MSSSLHHGTSAHGSTQGALAVAEGPESYRRVMERIRDLWRAGYAVILPHALMRMDERGVDTNDLDHLIRYGRITEHSRPMFLWRYKIEGRSADGCRMACVVEVDGRLIIVTVIA